MSKNAQILLENLIEQEFRNNDNYSNISEYFEFFSASQILKNQGLSDDEVDNGIVGKGLDGGCDSIYLFLNNSSTLSLSDNFLPKPPCLYRIGALFGCADLTLLILSSNAGFINSLVFLLNSFQKSSIVLLSNAILLKLIVFTWTLPTLSDVPPILLINPLSLSVWLINLQHELKLVTSLPT